MQNLGAGYPVLFQFVETLPVHAVPLAAPPEGVPPRTGSLCLERFERRHVAWDGVVVVVTLHYASQPRALFRNGSMSQAHKRLLQLLDFDPEPLGYRLALDEEPSRQSFHAAHVREAQKIEGLRFALPTLLSVLGSEASELDEACLIGMQCQPKLFHPRFERTQESVGLSLVLEPQDEVVGVADDDDIALRILPSPLVDP